MKDNLITELDDIYNHLVDYRNQLYLHLKNASLINELDAEEVEAIRQIRYEMHNLEIQITNLKDAIDLRVYCIQVTSTIETNIKILAKNEDDAIELACDIAETRIRKTLGREHDIDSYSEGHSLGDESPADDEADEEYDYR